MPKKLLRLFALLLALSLLAAACGGNDDDDAAPDGGDTGDVDDGDGDGDGDDVPVDEGDPVMGGELIIGLEAEATGLRPWEDAMSEPAFSMAAMIYDTWMKQDETGDYQGWLAESLEPNEDLTVWVMTIRDGIQFHDGTPVTAQTAVDMFALQQEGTAGSSQIANFGVQGAEATGDLEVTWTLAEPNAGFPSALATAGLGLVFEPAAAAADPDGFNDNPIGTGPFTLESRDIDNQTVLVRNESYWMSDEDGNQLPYLDRLTFRPIPDETTRLQSLTSGTVSAFETRRQATIRDAREAAEGGAFTSWEFQGNNTGGGHYNTAVAPYDDKRVRNGLTLLNNQEAVIADLGGEGISDPATQMFAPDDPFYSEAVAEAWPDFDVEAGTAAIQAYVDDPERSDGKAVGEPIDVELSCPPDPTLLAAMAVLEQVWSSTGLINVELSNFDQATHINVALGLENNLIGEHGAHCWRFGGQADPVTTIDVQFGDPATTAGNFSNFYTEELDAVLTEAAQTLDVEERAALYEEAGLIIADETPIWFSGHTATAIVTVPELKGLASWTLPSGDLGNGHPSAIGMWSQVWLAS